jgi:alcohol dehydrogenase class IV
MPIRSAFELVVPSRIVFGWGERARLGALARSLGRRAFVVSGSRSLAASGILPQALAHLRDAGVEPVPVGEIRHEPLVDDVDRLVGELLAFGAAPGDLVVAIGGGSAIDLAKGAAALVTNRGGASVRDYLEGVGTGLVIDVPPLPVLAVPTTAGTGSEATKNAVISSYEPPFKKSLRSEQMVPRIVLIDPELTVSAPPAVTAATGMDAITQLIESYLSRRATPVTRQMAQAGLEGAVPALLEAFREGRSRPARETMARAAFLSGVALANSGLGLAHGVAAALGIHCRVPHGLACAVMLPAAIRYNLSDRRVAEEFSVISPLIVDRTLGNASTNSAAALTRIEQLLGELMIPRRLSALGVTREQLPAIVRDSAGNSMRGNPRDVTDEELFRLLEEML